MSLAANRLKPGIVVEFENDLWLCMDAIHKTQGRKSGFVQAKLRNIKNGTQKEHKFSSQETLERAHLVEKSAQFLYQDDDGYHFMDQESYEQHTLDPATLGDDKNYLLPDAIVQLTYYEDKPIGLKLKQRMAFKIIEAEPNLKGATATATYKNATIETGLNVKVPQFIEVDNVIVVNTETGEYMEREK